MSDKKKMSMDDAKALYIGNVEIGSLAALIDPNRPQVTPEPEQPKAAPETATPTQIDLSRPLWEIDPDFINPFEEVPPLQTWATIGSRPAIPKEGLITFSAKQKKGKSLSTYAFAIPLLSGKVFDTMQPADRPNMIMVFDMEMGKTTLHNRLRAQLKAIGGDANAIPFVVCNLKGKGKDEMRATITAKVDAYHPDIVVIDQAAKLVDNGNDLGESNVITNFLDTLSIGRSVWVVMHENKSKEDENMKGHLGSFLSYAAVEAYTVDRKDGIFSVTLKEARESDPTNAEPLRFALNPDTGQISDASKLYFAAQSEEVEKWRKDFSLIFGDDEELRAKDLCDRLIERQQIEKRSAQTKINKAREIGAIKKKGNGKFDPYILTSSIEEF